MLVAPVDENINVCSNGSVRVADVPEITFTLFNNCAWLCVIFVLIVTESLEIVNGVVVTLTPSFVSKLYVVLTVLSGLNVKSLFTSPVVIVFREGVVSYNIKLPSTTASPAISTLV